MDHTLIRCCGDSHGRDRGTGRDVPLTDVITRHVKQVADFNKALEKRRLWREREKELQSQQSDSCGVPQDSGSRERRRRTSNPVSRSAKKVLDSIVVDGVDEEVVEIVKEKVARTFGSHDAHSAMRQSIAKQKERRHLLLQNELSDAWMADRFYTEELKQKTPWLNPVEFLNELQPRQRDGSLTPVASNSDGDSRKLKKKSKKKKERKKAKKKAKKHKKVSVG